MQILINGVPFQCATPCTLDQLPALLEQQESALAFAVQGQVIHRDRWPEYQLEHNDKIDVFTVVAGG